MIKVLETFVKDHEAWEMFITGPAGTGKTTTIGDVVQYCIDNKIEHTVCAFTHKACGVLKTKLPDNANIRTLHSFLKKRPTINDNAKNVAQIETNTRVGEYEKCSLLIVDEFSMIGEEDLMDIREKQDPDYDGDATMKVIWVGDLNQLPPVKDAQAVTPFGKYWIKLTKVHRQAIDNPLIDTLSDIVEMIEGAPVKPLQGHKTFLRDCEDFLEQYKADTSDKVILCYTNQAVQHWNASVRDEYQPKKNDMLFSPTAHRYFEFIEEVPAGDIAYVDRLWDDPLAFNSKYKTLEFILANPDYRYFKVLEDGEDYIYPVIFGTYDYKLVKDRYGNEATQANREIMTKHGDARQWSQENYTHPLARARAHAWRQYLTLKDTVVCMDFPDAMTVHKSQGSTFETVYIDAENLSFCAEKNMKLYLRLFYVAISRASKLVVTN